MQEPPRKPTSWLMAVLTSKTRGVAGRLILEQIAAQWHELGIGGFGAGKASAKGT